MYTIVLQIVCKSYIHLRRYLLGGGGSGGGDGDGDGDISGLIKL